MVAGSEVDRQLLERVAGIYKWLDLRIGTGSDIAGTCRACGDCCDFEGFDHRLFITPPELMYLAANLGALNIKPVTSRRCPYSVEGKCSVYEYRFSGCRIFCCKGDVDFQSRLSEEVLQKLKSICLEFQIPYRYVELAAGLGNLAGV